MTTRYLFEEGGDEAEEEEEEEGDDGPAFWATAEVAVIEALMSGPCMWMPACGFEGIIISASWSP